MPADVNSVAGSLALVPLYAVTFCLFFLPGAWGVVVVRQSRLPAVFVPFLMVVVSALAGYATFWAYFASPNIGRSVSAAILGASLSALFVRPARAALLRILQQEDIYRPLLLMGAVGLFYLSVLYAVRCDRAEEAAIYRFPGTYVAIDNILPLLLADRWAAGQGPQEGGLVGDWLCSDRPPLQAGLVLAQRPLADLIRLPPGLHYQALGTVLQATWVLAVWAAARCAGLQGRRLALVLAFPIASGFGLFNTVFVWPKMLAGTLVLTALTLLVLRERSSKPLSLGRAILAGSAAALGMLAHGGVAFTLLAAGPFLLWPRYFPGLKSTAAALAAFALLLLPWYAYGRFCDPPANRLVKWHLAGVVPVDDRTAGQAIADAYAEVGWRGAINNKVANVRALLGWPLVGAVIGTDGPVAWWQSQEYYHVFKALGALNVGWVVLLVSLVRRGWRKGLPFLADAGALLALALLSLGVWALLMFGPATTQVYQGSYATMLLLFLGLAMQIAALPFRWACAILGLHASDFCAAWLLGGPGNVPINWVVVFLAALVLAGLLFGLFRLAKCSESAAPLRHEPDIYDSRVMV